MEQSYIIKIIRSFSNNPRKEIKKAFKVYFIDLGVRNAVIDNVSLVENRNDKGAIFENFFIMERIKNTSVKSFSPNFMFWKDRVGREVDLVEYLNGEVLAYECKWNADSEHNFKEFLKLYPKAKTEVVSPDKML